MTNADHHTIRLASAGDERAMRSLWTQYAPAVDAVVRRMVSDPDHSQDVAQEVWIQIFRALPDFRGEAQLSTWIHRIAVNRTLNALRRLRRLDRAETEITEDSAQVEHEGDRALLASTIGEAVERLAPGARTVFLLHDVEGYTHEEIAAELGITAGGSKSQLFKARSRLRKLLAHLVDSRPPPGSGGGVAPTGASGAGAAAPRTAAPGTGAAGTAAPAAGVHPARACQPRPSHQPSHVAPLC